MGPDCQVVKCPAAMSGTLRCKQACEDEFTLGIGMTATVGELKAMLLEKHHQDPVMRKVLKVILTRYTSVIEKDDAEKLDEAWFLDNEPLTVVYAKNEVTAATKQDISTEKCFEMNIRPDVKEISDYAFSKLHHLVVLRIPESATYIRSFAFDGCDSLESITMGKSVTHIGGCAFRDCFSLKSITLNESVTHIGCYAFYRCFSLESITLGKSATCFLPLKNASL